MKINAARPEIGRISNKATTYAKDMPEKIDPGNMQQTLYYQSDIQFITSYLQS